MYKLRRVYICDACDAVSLPGTWATPCGDIRKILPKGWEKVGGMHFCPACYEAWRLTVLRKDASGGTNDVRTEAQK